MAEQFNKCGTRLHLFCMTFFREAQPPPPVPSGGAVHLPIEAETQKISA